MASGGADELTILVQKSSLLPSEIRICNIIISRVHSLNRATPRKEDLGRAGE